MIVVTRNSSRAKLGASLQLESLNEKLNVLTVEMNQSSSSSNRLALALNILTGALVLVDIWQIVIQYLKP